MYVCIYIYIYIHIGYTGRPVKKCIQLKDNIQHFFQQKSLKIYKYKTLISVFLIFSTITSVFH